MATATFQSAETAHQNGRSRSYTTNQPYNSNESSTYRPTLLEPVEVDNNSGEMRLVCSTFHRQSEAYGNPHFLNAISAIGLQPVAYTSTKRTWKYGDRHTAQPTLPFLYLGPHTVARDAVWLAEHDITMVIAVRSAQSAAVSPRLLDPARFPACQNLLTATFDVDSPYEVITRVKPILKLMTDHLETQTAGRSLTTLDDIGGRILVFCESGNERSPVLVAAWLMMVFGITWSDSLNLIHAFRFSIALTSGMNEMLSTLQMVLKAEADAAEAQRGMDGQEMNTQSTTSRMKRSIDDAYDSDDTMTDEMEVAPRTGIAPFLDKNSRSIFPVRNMNK